MNKASETMVTKTAVNGTADKLVGIWSIKNQSRSTRKRVFIEETKVSVLVEGTTFHAVYGVVGNHVELTSPDLGESTASLDGRPPKVIARGRLEEMARAEILRTDVPFLKDPPRVTSAHRMVDGVIDDEDQSRAA